MRYPTLTLLLILLISNLNSFGRDDFKAIDKYARATPKTAESSITSLATYLKKGAKNDIEKARSIYSWIANNIHYDDNGYNTKNYSDVSPNAVFKNRVAVCEGYSRLYKALADSMGLEAQVISGYAKAFGYNVSEKITSTNHAWNAVKADGKWRLMDVTWGSSRADDIAGKALSHQEFDDYWFDTDPYEFLFKHYPAEEKWTLIPQHISLNQYVKMPDLDEYIFKLGFDARRLLGKAMLNNVPELPQAYDTKYHLKTIKFPLSASITAAPEYTFVIESDEDVEIAFINNSEWHYMYRNGHQYTIKLPLQKGSLEVAVKGKGASDSYTDILKYRISKS
ncbi:MAG: hypothetical protein JWO06_3396 [Bacteroidota bacterium]|nr:hypothetical protein [Bacteroidota bacterium]